MNPILLVFFVAAGWASALAAERVAPRALASRARWVPGAVGLLAAVGAATTPASPTAIEALDVLLRCGAAAAVAVAATRARRSSTLLLAGAAGLFVASPTAAAAAGLALGAMLASAGTIGRSRLLGGLAGAGATTAMLRADAPLDPWFAPLLFGAAGMVVVVSALRRLRRRERRRPLVALGGLGLAAVAGVGAYGLGAAGARSDLERAVALTERGIEDARAGRSAEAASRLGEANARLERVGDRLHAWWAAPARAVPVVAQQVAGVEELVGTTRELTGALARTVEGADIERLRPREGAIDLAALRTLAGPLAETQALLDRVPLELEESRSPWLVSPLRQRVDELVERAADAAAELAAVREVVERLPGLLGADGERRWFLAALTPSEPRGSGGHLGNWGILVARDGRLTIEQTGRSADLVQRGPFVYDVDEELDRRWIPTYGLARYPQNLAVSPHFPSSGAAMVQMARQAGLGDVDGVLAVDPVGLAGLLEVTGPVEVPMFGTLDAGNATRALLFEQYLDPRAPGRADALEAATRLVFEAALRRPLPSPRAIVDRLRPAVEGRHLQLHSSRPAEQGWFSRLGVAGGLRPVQGDAVGLFVQDATASKLGWFLRRNLRYDVTVDADGRTEGVLEARLRNTAPAELPGTYFGQNRFEGQPDGTHRLFVTAHTGVPVRRVTVDGVEVPLPSNVSERGRYANDLLVDVAPGAEVVIRFEVAGSLPPTEHYRLEADLQPLVVPDELLVRVNGRTLHEGPQRRALTLDATVAP